MTDDERRNDDELGNSLNNGMNQLANIGQNAVQNSISKAAKEGGKQAASAAAKEGVKEGNAAYYELTFVQAPHPEPLPRLRVRHPAAPLMSRRKPWRQALRSVNSGTSTIQ